MTTLHDPTNKSDFVALHLPFLRTNVGENCSRQTRVFLYRTRSAEMRSIFPQQQAPDNNAVYLVLEVLKKYIYIYIHIYIMYIMHTSDLLSVLIQNLAVKSGSALQESIKIA